MTILGKIASWFSRPRRPLRIAPTLDLSTSVQNDNGGASSADLLMQTVPAAPWRRWTDNLPPDWRRYVVAEGVSEQKPGIYEWTIEDVGCYIGKYTKIDRPKNHYSRKVGHMLAGRPYRPADPNGFRRIHRALAEAVTAERLITLCILENVEPGRLHAREQELIAARRHAMAAARLISLNA
jgi:hypothetical protein